MTNPKIKVIYCVGSNLLIESTSSDWLDEGHYCDIRCTLYNIVGVLLGKSGKNIKK